MKNIPSHLMYKYSCFCLLLALVTSQNGFNQTLRAYLGFGGVKTTFQDSRQSDLQFKKTVFAPELGLDFAFKNSLLYMHFTGFAYENVHPATDSVKYNSVNINLQIGYAYNIKTNMYLGSTWNVLDYTIFDIPSLKNNDNSYLNFSDLLITGIYKKDLTKGFYLNSRIDYGIFSIAKVAPSFTVNMPQNVIDNGDMSFQDASTRDPFSLKYFEPRFIWNQVYISTNFELMYKKRLSISYNWQMRCLWDNINYPVTLSNHNISLKFYFTNHEFTAK
jgi:hypothetical protein